MIELIIKIDTNLLESEIEEIEDSIQELLLEYVNENEITMEVKGNE
jgi:hypothetical protein